MLPASSKGPPPENPPSLRFLDYPTLLLASGLGTGFLRPYAGSWGSIPPLFIGWYLISTQPPWVFSAVVAGVTALAVLTAERAQYFWGHDAKKITIDEYAGMLVTLIGLPTIWWVYLASFFAFRFFDILKPPPARQLESLPGGLGITLDDVAAGIYANILMRLVLWLMG